MNETCAYYSQGYIANPDNCQAWGYCSGGILVANGTCPTGYLYDSYKAICNYASQVQCSTSVNDTCANLADPGIIANPSNCNQYCTCINNVVTGCKSCPADQLYNPSTRACEYGYQCPTDSVCRLVKNNAFVGAPNSCGQFIRCLDGTGTAASCSTGFYNQLTGNCQSTNPCSATNTDTATTPAPSTAACASYNSTKGGVQYFSDNSTCYGYYTCSSETGSGLWRSCEFATHFNGTIEKCVSPASCSCTFNRCGNINLQFVTKAYSECKEYYVCNNQQQTSTTASACPNANFPYFDEINAGCVPVKPTYPICNATAPANATATA
ncbi:PREDICTED: peritrophin-44-like [Rhagoletis zephyria]|uniref:peritrophin-44-like n=1 Tax=Rhagoletis zephyria TaxID=28612 RepID=UPI00081161C8|nr:PREDICTED: peritrophin-44-like [Rhagoletis zephyria]